MGINSITWDNEHGAYWSVVIPETVGEFIGLLDKNEKEIYEGDIILISPDGIKAPVVFQNNGFWLKVETGDLAKFEYYIPNKDFREVVGNIHENPELLK